MSKQTRSLFTPLAVTPLEDGKRWRLINSFSYRTRRGVQIGIPAGFVTDFASVPRLTDPFVALAALFLTLIGYTTGNDWCFGVGYFFTTILVLLAIFRKTGKHNKADAIHDWLYQGHKVSRRAADRIFKEAMEDLNVKQWRVVLMYGAVRAFGWLAYRKK